MPANADNTANETLKFGFSTHGNTKSKAGKKNPSGAPITIAYAYTYLSRFGLSNIGTRTHPTTTPPTIPNSAAGSNTNFAKGETSAMDKAWLEPKSQDMTTKAKAPARGQANAQNTPLATI